MLKYILIVITLAAAALAQTRPFVDGALGINTAGYKIPVLGVAAGVEREGAHYLASAALRLESARKVDPDNGWRDGAGAFLLGKVGHALAGGGYAAGTLHTSAWRKSAAQPSLDAGIDFPRWRAVERYTFAGVNRNGVRSYDSEITIKWRPHFWESVFAEAWSFYPTDAPHLPRMVTSNIGLTLRFIL